MIPQAFHAQTIFSDRLKVFSSGYEGYIFSCLRQKKAKTSAGSASSDPNVVDADYEVVDDDNQK